MFDALPHGCDHIDWTWSATPDADRTVQELLSRFHDGEDVHGYLTAAEQFATWAVPAGGESAELPVRERELAAQGLAMAGDPHLCQTDPDSGTELWAVELTSAG